MCVMLTLFFFLLFLYLACPWLCLCRVTLFLWLNLPWHFASRLSAVVCLSGCCHIFALAISSFNVLQAFCLLFCCTVRSTLSWGVGLSGRCIDHRRVSLSLGFQWVFPHDAGFYPSVNVSSSKLGNICCVFPSISGDSLTVLSFDFGVLPVLRPFLLAMGWVEGITLHVGMEFFTRPAIGG